MAYTVTAADMTKRYDERTLADMCSDQGSPATGDYLTDSPILTALLSAAVGEVKASILKSERYTADELDALTGSGLEHLVDLTCTIAWYYLWRRRPCQTETDIAQRKEAREEAEKVLKQLRTGEIVLDIDTAQAAGNVDAVAVDRTTLDNWNNWSNAPRGRYYPVRRFPQ